MSGWSGGGKVVSRGIGVHSGGSLRSLDLGDLSLKKWRKELQRSVEVDTFF